MTRTFSAAAVSLLAMTACGGPTSQLTRRHEAPSPLLAPVYTEDGLKGERFDVDLNGAPDIIKYRRYSTKDGRPVEDPRTMDSRTEYESVIVRQELDTNLDGVLDVVRTYDGAGRLSGETIDANLDGSFDRQTVIKDGRVTKDFVDANQNGIPEQTRYYADGDIRRIETDSNEDGRPDVWSQFDHGALTRIGYDFNADGTIDEWQSQHLTLKTLRPTEGSGDVTAPAAAPSPTPAAR